MAEKKEAAPKAAKKAPAKPKGVPVPEDYNTYDYEVVTNSVGEVVEYRSLRD